MTDTLFILNSGQRYCALDVRLLSLIARGTTLEIRPCVKRNLISSPIHPRSPRLRSTQSVYDGTSINRRSNCRIKRNVNIRLRSLDDLIFHGMRLTDVSWLRIRSDEDCRCTALSSVAAEQEINLEKASQERKNKQSI